MTFHFIITLAIQGGMATFDSTYVTAVGETRQDVYRKVSGWAKAKVATDGAGQSTVVFFSLEPNDLSTEAGR